ncbi:MAG TPA: hypothetical protein VMT86_09735 [Bryobacteraceae bacterium]|nr:hypothetical protein [Bryobacteraceae bacterium]
MLFYRMAALALAVCTLAGPVSGQGETLRADGPHPRIFLGARRLKLLKRESERQSLRWNQFNLLMAGKAPMPEPGFASALYYAVSGNREAGEHAAAWAVGPGADLRQLALVFDWCQDVLTADQSKALAAKLVRGIQQSRPDTSVSAIRSRLLAAVALSGFVTGIPEREFDRVVQQWWEGAIVPALASGREVLTVDDLYPLMEILHVVRDNFNEDLREAAPGYFRDLGTTQLLSYYPATYPAGENEYRIPVTHHPGSGPDLRRAALSRAAELSMVSYDTNAAGSQFLQGWLMNDNFLLRGTFGAPYEFLWANPYQPGLSYYQAPLVIHDSLFGRLFVRSSWEESATWLGWFGGELQVFNEGRVTDLDPQDETEPLDLGRAMILFGSHTLKFKVTVPRQEPVFVVGLRPRRNYLIEVDDEELAEASTDPGGILALDLPHDAEVGVRLREDPAQR